MPPGKVVINQPLATLATSLPRLAPAQFRHTQGGHGTTAAQCVELHCFAGSQSHRALCYARFGVGIRRAGLGQKRSTEVVPKSGSSRTRSAPARAMPVRRWTEYRLSHCDEHSRLPRARRHVEPNPADLEVLKKEREARLVNRIEPDRLGTDDGPGAAATPTAKASARGGGGRKAVLVAIEAVLVAKGVPEKQRASVMAAATEKLAQRIRDGQAPKVKVYDKAAPSHRPAVMPTPEVLRTRERAAPVR